MCIFHKFCSLKNYIEMSEKCILLYWPLLLSLKETHGQDKSFKLFTTPFPCANVPSICQTPTSPKLCCKPTVNHVHALFLFSLVRLLFSKTAISEVGKPPLPMTHAYTCTDTCIDTTSSWVITHCPSWLLITKRELSKGKHWLMANKSKLMSYLYFNYQPCSQTSISALRCN